ncbi:MAG: HEPN domain-containing protein [Tepidisphaeraceae bacterium]|jgi:HEPN domain-containing protein
MRARKSPNFDSATFHAQQCVEKYLKAQLQEAGVIFPHTHDLVNLLNLVLPAQPLWTVLKSSATILTQYAVKARYPGSWITRSQAKDAVARCRDIRRHIRQSLGLRT